MTSKVATASFFAGVLLLATAGFLFATESRQYPTPERKLQLQQVVGIWPKSCGSVSCCEDMGLTSKLYVCPETGATPSSIAGYTYSQCIGLGAIMTCPADGTTPTDTPTAAPGLPTMNPEHHALASSALVAYTGTVAGTAASVYGVLITQLILMGFFACLYNMQVVEPVIEKKGILADRKERKEALDFSVNICQCFDDIWVCIHGLFCPLARMAATMATAGVCGYWESICFWCLCAMFVPLGPCCLTVFFRMRLKEIMNIRDNPLNDIIVACLCPNLAICQEGTAVDHAMGYEVVGCCDVEWDSKLKDDY